LLLDPSHLAVPLIATQTSYNAPFPSIASIYRPVRNGIVFLFTNLRFNAVFMSYVFLAWILKRAREYPTWQEAMVS
jgi:hypothetical protein